MNYPNLQNTKLISLDLETKDSDIRKLGPGYYRSKGENYILCVAISTVKKDWAFPWNEHTKNWLSDNTHLSIIGANIMYDFGWLMARHGIIFKGNYYDILINESLIDGGRSWYNLDKLAQQYLGVGKGHDEIKEYCDNMGWKGDPRQHLWRMFKDPHGKKLVLKYNKSDTRQTFDIFHKQLEVIKKYQLEKVFALESDCLKPLLQMKKNGVKIDLIKLEQSEIKVEKRIRTLQKSLDKMAEFHVNVAAAASMKKLFEKFNLTYPYTDKNNPSFTSDFLENVQHTAAQKCIEIRKLSKLQSTYLEGFVKFVANGRVYTEFHSIRNGKRGTQTGRFSATNPALQTIPKKGEGKNLARELFIPEEGYLWEKQDQSQEEYRIFSHYARGEGAQMLRDGYINEPDFDMHSWTNEYTNLKSRETAKTINFMSIYGGGVHKFAMAVGLPVPPKWDFKSYDEYLIQKEEIRNKYKAGKLFFGYHDRLPCIKATAKAAEKACKDRGYAKTFFDRRRYFKNDDAWKSLNTTVQGTGGDIIKKWMVDCNKAGLWSILKLHLTVHDELDFSKPQTKEGEEAAKEVQKIGETCVKLRVPLKVDREHGPNWAMVKEI